MKKILFIALLACMQVVTVQAQLLWKISGNGLEQPSYLMGTHHLAPLSITDSIAGFNDAFTASQQVIGELVMSEIQTPEVMQIMQQTMMIESDTTIQRLFLPDEYEMVNQFTKENLMLDLAMAPKLKPAFIQNNLIVVLYIKTIGGFNPAEQLDAYFQAEGTAKGKKVSGLETPAYQFNLLYNSTSLQRQAELLVCTLSNIDKSLNETKELTDAYMAQNLEELYLISQKKHNDKCDATPAEMAALLDNRNIQWAEILPEKMQEAPAFIAVGALHLPGDNGVINLLRQKGYQVEPIQ